MDSILEIRHRWFHFCVPSTFPSWRLPPKYFFIKFCCCPPGQPKLNSKDKFNQFPQYLPTVASPLNVNVMFCCSSSFVEWHYIACWTNSRPPSTAFPQPSFTFGNGVNHIFWTYKKNLLSVVRVAFNGNQMCVFRTLFRNIGKKSKMHLVGPNIESFVFICLLLVDIIWGW